MTMIMMILVVVMMIIIVTIKLVVMMMMVMMMMVMMMMITEVVTTIILITIISTTPTTWSWSYDIKKFRTKKRERQEIDINTKVAICKEANTKYPQQSHQRRYQRNRMMLKRRRSTCQISCYLKNKTHACNERTN